MFMYDPRTNQVTEHKAQDLADMSGYAKDILASTASRKKRIKSLGCYLSTQMPTLADRRIWYAKEKYENESWVEVQGSEGAFLISNYGRTKRVYKTSTKFLLPFLYRRKAFLMVKVRLNGIYKEYKVAHLVAMHFLGPIPLGKGVLHKNGILTDDFAGNLAYVDKTEIGKRTGFKSRSRPVVKVDPKTMEVLEEYRSAREAGRKCFLSYQTVVDNVNHKTESAGGMLFMWEAEYEEKHGEDRQHGELLLHHTGAL